MFMHARNSSRLTAPRSTSMPVLTPDTTCTPSGSTLMLAFVFVSACARANCAASVSMAPDA
jgi:hypothetical protein